MRNWKKLYVLGGLCCVAGIGSCFDRKEELPNSIFPVAQAAELSLSSAPLLNDHTRGVELRFEAGQARLDRASEAELANFLRDPSGRVAEYKVLIWLPADEITDEARSLAELRASALKSLLGNETPVTLVRFAEREASNLEAAVLAIME